MIDVLIIIGLYLLLGILFTILRLKFFLKLNKEKSEEILEKWTPCNTIIEIIIFPITVLIFIIWLIHALIMKIVECGE